MMYTLSPFRSQSSRACWKYRTPLLLAATAVLFILPLLSVICYAQGGYPLPQDLYVNDYAGLLTKDHANNIRTLFSSLKSEKGIEAVVLTINSIHDYATGDNTIESFATHLFNTWGIGNRERNDGVLILVAVKDRQVRIELGAGYERSWDAAMQKIIDEQMLPSFRQSDYSAGIYNGALSLAKVLTGGSLSATGESSSPPNQGSVPVAAISGGAVAVIGGASYGLWQFPHYRRYRKRNCPNCGAPMTLLDEVSDDVYLDSGQKVEELLKSVNYDVWKCTGCGMHTLHGYKSWFGASRFKKCAKCGYSTLEVIRTTLVHPTYTATGRERITRKCRNCDYLDEEIITLARLVEHDRDSSGSSFGGGHSSGGGASGRW